MNRARYVTHAVSAHAVHASVNSFTQLVLKSRQRDGVWRKWAARVPKMVKG